MNANELADELKEVSKHSEPHTQIVLGIAESLLRQQQAEIEELEKENTDLRYLIATKLEQQAEIEMLEAELKAMREQLNANQV